MNHSRALAHASDRIATLPTTAATSVHTPPLNVRFLLCSQGLMVSLCSAKAQQRNGLRRHEPARIRHRNVNLANEVDFARNGAFCAIARRVWAAKHRSKVCLHGRLRSFMMLCAGNPAVRCVPRSSSPLPSSTRTAGTRSEQCVACSSLTDSWVRQVDPLASTGGGNSTET